MYKIRFTDNTEFMGGEPDNSLWNEIPKGKIIASLQYRFKDCTVTMKGFEKYCHLVNYAERIYMGKRQNFPTMESIVLLGKWQNKLYSLTWDLVHGIVERNVCDDLRNFKVTGWIPGESNPLIIPTMRPYA